MHALPLLMILADYQGGSMTPTGKGFYRVEIPEMRFDDRVKSARFDFVDPTVAGERFGGRTKPVADFVMVAVDNSTGPVTTARALAKMKEKGYRPANGEELVAFLVRYPIFARRFPMAALGKTWRGPDRVDRVLCASPHLGGMKLDIEYLNGEWTANIRFLAVMDRK